MSWYELAWMARNERIAISGTVPAWLGQLAQQVRTVPITPAIADIATAMPSSFPRDPVDRIIVATAIEHGWKLVTRDERLREHPQSKGITVW
jgi:PIN domain nuclease of toxin-antitoxin system